MLQPASAEHLELVLEPADDDIEHEAAAGNMVDRRRLLRGRDRVHQGRMHGREHRDLLRRGSDARRPGERLEGAVVEVGGAAIAFPAADRQEGLEARRVRHAGDLEIAFPGHRPGFRSSRHGRAAAAVERHHAQLHAVVAEDRVGLSGRVRRVEHGAYFSVMTHTPSHSAGGGSAASVSARPTYNLDGASSGRTFKASWKRAFALSNSRPR